MGMMVNKTCSWGMCKSDSRRKDHEDMKGVTFKRFPQPKTQRERCMEWIRRCNRPHRQLHIGNISYYHFVCSKHFLDGEEDPLSASNGTKIPMSRKRRSNKHPNETPAKQLCSEIPTCLEENETLTDVQGGNDGAASEAEIERASACGNLPSLHQLFSPVKESNTEPSSSKTATIADILSKESPRKRCKRSLKYTNSKSASQPACVKLTIKCNHCGNSVNMSETEIVAIGKERFMKYIQSNDDKCFHYTGVPNLATLYYIFIWLLPYVSNIKLWDGPKKSEKKERKRERTLLTHFEEFILTLLRIRRGYDVRFLSFLFGVSKSHVSKVFIAWVKFLNECFSNLIVWPSKEVNSGNMPKSFKDFPKTRAIIDCTEYFVQKPLRPFAQRATYSSYKHANTFKQLIAIMPTGSISFISKLYAGSISDLAIVKISGFLDLVEPGDDIMADRGFNIRHLLLKKQATLNIPAFSHGKCLSVKAVTKSRKIASVRIHVERAIRRMKTFKILSGIIPLKLRFYLDSITKIVAFLCNLQNKLAD